MYKGKVGTPMTTKRITKKKRDNAVDNYDLTEEEAERIRQQNLSNRKLSAKTIEKLKRRMEFEGR